MSQPRHNRSLLCWIHTDILQCLHNSPMMQPLAKQFPQTLHAALAGRPPMSRSPQVATYLSSPSLKSLVRHHQSLKTLENPNRKPRSSNIRPQKRGWNTHTIALDCCCHPKSIYKELVVPIIDRERNVAMRLMSVILWKVTTFQAICL